MIVGQGTAEGAYVQYGVVVKRADGSTYMWSTMDSEDHAAEEAERLAKRPNNKDAWVERRTITVGQWLRIKP